MCRARSSLYPSPLKTPVGVKNLAVPTPRISSVSALISLYKAAFDGDFRGADVHASIVKTEEAEALAKGLPARMLRYAVSGTTCDRRVRLKGRGGSAAVQHRAAAHIGGQGWKGIAWYRERVTRGTIHKGNLQESGAFLWSAACCSRLWSGHQSLGNRQSEQDGQRHIGTPCSQFRWHCVISFVDLRALSSVSQTTFSR